MSVLDTAKGKMRWSAENGDWSAMLKPEECEAVLHELDPPCDCPDGYGDFVTHRGATTRPPRPHLSRCPKSETAKR